MAKLWMLWHHKGFIFIQTESKKNMLFFKIKMKRPLFLFGICNMICNYKMKFHIHPIIQIETI